MKAVVVQAAMFRILLYIIQSGINKVNTSAQKRII